MNDEDVAAAFENLFDELVDMSDLDATWLRLASRILTFCSDYAPEPNALAGLPGGQPEGQIAAIEAIAISALATTDPTLASTLTNSGTDSGSGPLSFASGPLRNALRDVAQTEAASPAFGDRRLSLVVIARGLAGAIDELAGHTYLPWFRAKGELTLRVGEPYPVRHHDPRPWLRPHGCNSDPAQTPTWDYAFTKRLRIATALPFKCVINFECWNRLSPLGAAGRLVVAAAQPNLMLNEFDIDFADHPPSYVNRGPINAQRQALRVSALAEQASALSADVLLLPEYTLNEAAHTELLALNKDGTRRRPLIICTGAVDEGEVQGYVSNHGQMILNTPGLEHDYSVNTPAKSHQAAIGGAIERIERGCEVKVYASERWTMCVLICRDAIDEAIVAQLSRIGVNLLLIPALSPKTATMVGSATELCHRSQAFVVIANGPARWGTGAEKPASRLEAVFAGPYDESPNHVGVRTPDDVTGPAQVLWVFDFGRREMTTQILYND